jgi:hypothetical protein
VRGREGPRTCGRTSAGRSRERRHRGGSEIRRRPQGDELPKELQRRESRSRKIRGAGAAPEAEAKEEAAAEAEDAKKRIAERGAKEAAAGKKFGGRPPAVRDPEAAAPRDKAQRNFTDPDSRIMKDGATGSFVQAYNANAAVDGGSQVIVAASVTQQADDKRAFLPLLERIESNLDAKPDTVTADSGFFSEHNLTDPRFADVVCYVPPEKNADTPLANTMRETLASKEGEAVYRKRKSTVEPVFGQIKEARGFRRFSLRGFVSVSREWDLICTGHNILKLHRAGHARAPHEGR